MRIPFGGWKIMKPSRTTLSTLKQEIYLNAARLFGDACRSYEARSYATAFALSVLALEEIGKLNMVDHICDDIQINPDSNSQDFLNHLFSRSMYRSHTRKQAWATEPMLGGLTPRQAQSLDRAKQDAIYVTYTGRRITRPRVFPSARALAQIRQVHRAMYQVEDVGFNGFEGHSSAPTRARARRVLGRVDKWYERVRKR
jgi:AbiV family abortive infection protein